MARDEPTIRPSVPGDLDQVLAVAARSLGWAADERDRAFFRWKHEENPAGPSPGWVAVEDGQVIGFRTFLRWAFADGDARLEMARAVDTATDPDHQGRGLFRRLTLQAVDDLISAGVDAIFNTPNAQSRPGYLKMGWQALGRPTIGVRPASLGRVPLLRQARTAAEKWSEPCTIGEPAAAALAASGVAELVACLRPRGWSTPRTLEHLAWRYRFEPLHYRVVEAGGGLVVFRVRRRGPAREVAIVEWLAPRADRRALARLVRSAGDYAVAIGPGLGHGLVPLPRQGPIVTWRALANPSVPSLGDLSFSLGDLELF
jgi:GNAT superfamily N-acetyltransferase